MVEYDADFMASLCESTGFTNETTAICMLDTVSVIFAIQIFFALFLVADFRNIIMCKAN